MIDTEDFIKRSIFGLLAFGKSTITSTALFRKQKHDKDLVPNFNDKLNEILGYFDRYRKISYDIQGIRDKGVDVLLKYEYDFETRLIGLQIKSYNDLETESWMKNLKAQVLDAINFYGVKNLQDFYVIFCTDVLIHKAQIRNATADLVSMPNFPIHVITPEHALNFLQMEEYLIVSYLKRKLSEDDPVVIEGQEELARLSLAQSAMVIEAASIYINEGRRELNYDEIIESSFVDNIYLKYPNIPARLFESNERSLRKLKNIDLENNPLEDLQIVGDHSHLFFQTHSELADFNQRDHNALLSLMYEGMARHKYNYEEVKWYVFNLLKFDEIAIAKKFASFVSERSRALKKS
jgi:hypothetical protein